VIRSRQQAIDEHDQSNESLSTPQGDHSAPSKLSQTREEIAAQRRRMRQALVSDGLFDDADDSGPQDAVVRSSASSLHRIGSNPCHLLTISLFHAASLVVFVLGRLCVGVCSRQTRCRLMCMHSWSHLVAHETSTQVQNLPPRTESLSLLPSSSSADSKSSSW
jgi:hypothetical protein